MHHNRASRVTTEDKEDGSQPAFADVTGARLPATDCVTMMATRRPTCPQAESAQVTSLAVTDEVLKFCKERENIRKNIEILTSETNYGKVFMLLCFCFVYSTVNTSIRRG